MGPCPARFRSRDRRPPHGIADGDAFWTEVRVPLTIVDDTEAEGDETLRLILEMSPALPFYG